MGIAAYNRGSKAISNQLYPQDVRQAIAHKPADDPLPEGILRSSYMPDSDTQVFLSYENRWYLIHTRFQVMKRCRSLKTAIKVFTAVEFWGRCAIAHAHWRQR